MKSCIVLLGFLAITAAPNAMALSVTLEQGPYSAGIGGEFVAAAPASDPGLANYLQYYSPLTQYTGNPADGSPGLYGFATFCVEYNEEFTPGGTYSVAIGPNAMNGGLPAGAGGDPISRGTAYLYYLFATGNQTFGYNWGAGRLNSAGQLQNAIWWLEGEGPSGPPAEDPNNIFENLVVSTFGSAANAMADNDNLFPVEVMVLGTPGAVQDQLILTGVPDGGTTLVLLGAGLGGIALFKRRLGR